MLGLGLGGERVYIPSLSPDIKCIHSFLKDIIQTLSPIFIITRKSSPNKQQCNSPRSLLAQSLASQQGKPPTPSLHTFPLFLTAACLVHSTAIAQDFQSTCTYTTTSCYPPNGPTETITAYEVPFTATSTSTYDCSGCNHVSVFSKECYGPGLVSL